MAGRENVCYEAEKSTRWVAGYDVEWHESSFSANDIAIVRVEYAEVVLLAVVASGGDALKAQRGKPRVDLCLTHRENIEAWLGSHNRKISIRLG